MSRITNSGRFMYAITKTKERAENVLEEMFATGDVMSGEDPRIEAIRDHHQRIKSWAVTLPN